MDGTTRYRLERWRDVDPGGRDKRFGPWMHVVSMVGRQMYMYWIASSVDVHMLSIWNMDI